MMERAVVFIDRAVVMAVRPSITSISWMRLTRSEFWI